MQLHAQASTPAHIWVEPGILRVIQPAEQYGIQSKYPSPTAARNSTPPGHYSAQQTDQTAGDVPPSAPAAGQFGCYTHIRRRPALRTVPPSAKSTTKPADVAPATHHLPLRGSKVRTAPPRAEKSTTGAGNARRVRYHLPPRESNVALQP